MRADIFRVSCFVIALGLSNFSVSWSAKAETLQEALISAYQNHPRLQAERAQLRELDETYVQARAQGGLTSSVSGSATADFTRTPSLTIPIAGFDDFITSGTTVSAPIGLQLQAIQPIYQGGRVSALKSQAKSGIMAAREGLRSTETDLFVEVANAYVEVLRSEETARIRRNNVQVLMRQKDAADSRFELGAGTRTDVALAEARLAGAKIGLARAESALQVARASYRQATGHMPESLQPTPLFALPPTEVEAMRIAQSNNPGLLASAYNETAGDAAIKAAKSARKPTVSLTGSLGARRGQAGFPERAESASIGAQVSIPLTSGGLNRSRVRAAENARTRLMLETRDAKRRIESAIMQSWAGLNAAKAALENSEVQVQAAELALEGVELEREVGTRNALDVLNAEQELLEAKLAIIDSQTEVKKAEFRLLALMGGFDALSLSLPVEYYDPEKNFREVSDDGIISIIEDIVPKKWR